MALADQLDIVIPTIRWGGGTHTHAALAVRSAPHQQQQEAESQHPVLSSCAAGTLIFWSSGDHSSSHTTSSSCRMGTQTKPSRSPMALITSCTTGNEVLVCLCWLTHTHNSSDALLLLWWWLSAQSKGSCSAAHAPPKAAAAWQHAAVAHFIQIMRSWLSVLWLQDHVNAHRAVLYSLVVCMLSCWCCYSCNMQLMQLTHHALHCCCHTNCCCYTQLLLRHQLLLQRQLLQD